MIGDTLDYLGYDVDTARDVDEEYPSVLMR